LTLKKEKKEIFINTKKLLNNKPITDDELQLLGIFFSYKNIRNELTEFWNKYIEENVSVPESVLKHSINAWNTLKVLDFVINARKIELQVAWDVDIVITKNTDKDKNLNIIFEDENYIIYEIWDKVHIKWKNNTDLDQTFDKIFKPNDLIKKKNLKFNNKHCLSVLCSLARRKAKNKKEIIKEEKEKTERLNEINDLKIKIKIVRNKSKYWFLNLDNIENLTWKLNYDKIIFDEKNGYFLVVVWQKWWVIDIKDTNKFLLHPCSDDIPEYNTDDKSFKIFDWKNTWRKFLSWFTDIPAKYNDIKYLWDDFYEFSNDTEFWIYMTWLFNNKLITYLAEFELETELLSYIKWIWFLYEDDGCEILYWINWKIILGSYLELDTIIYKDWLWFAVRNSKTLKWWFYNLSWKEIIGCKYKRNEIIINDNESVELEKWWRKNMVWTKDDLNPDNWDSVVIINKK